MLKEQMSLVARLKPLVETVLEMEAAAEDRYQDGQKLVLDTYYHSGIYLLGYAAEIWLKTAICRADPAMTLTDTVGSRIGPARYRWQETFGGRLPSGHDLLFLSLSLEDARERAGKSPLNTISPILSRLFNTSISLIDDNWFVEMRYRHQDASSAEAQQTLDGVEWLRSNYEFLWS